MMRSSEGSGSFRNSWLRADFYVRGLTLGRRDPGSVDPGSVVSDGSGTIGIDEPLYLLKWSPKVKFSFGEPEGDDLYIAYESTRSLTCSYKTAPPGSAEFQNTVEFYSSTRNGEDDLSFNPTRITLGGGEVSVDVTALQYSLEKDDITVYTRSLNPNGTGAAPMTSFLVVITNMPHVTCYRSSCPNSPTWSTLGR